VSDHQRRLNLAELVRSCIRSKALLKGGVSTALALSAIAVSPVVNAQGAPAAAEPKAEGENMQEITVTGLRRSLETAQEIKKNAEVFVDSITAEDIGALPDRSVTEALQRVPGVSISRFAAGADPDHFSIEGSGVVVRGLPQVRSELNGRDTFSANAGRFLSFSDVAPELLGGVDVYKNQSADLIEGGLAGTVNLRTLTPFDVDGQRISFSLEGNYGDFAEELAPTASGLYTNRWSVGDGEIGFLFDVAYSELKSRSDGIQISSFKEQARDNLFGAGTPVWVPEGAAFRSQAYDRERLGIASAFQWKNSDDSMRATLQFLRTNATTQWVETGSEIATDVGGQATQGAGQGEGPGDLEFALVDGYDAGYGQVGAANMFTHGVITTDAGWKDDQRHDGWGSDWDATGRDGRSPLWGLPSNNLLRGVDQEYMTQDIGFNFKWDINENWGSNFDAQYVKSTVTNLDMSMWTANFQNVSIDLRGSVPEVQFISPLQTETGATLTTCPAGQPVDFSSGCTPYMNSTAPNTYDPFNNYWRAAMDHGEDSEGDEMAFKMDFDRKFEGSLLTSVKFGARYSKREQDIRSTTWNWGALAETWGGRGPVWLDEHVDGVPNTNGLASYTGGVVTGDSTYVSTFDNFMRGRSPTPAPVRLYNGNLIGQSYEEATALALMIGEEWRPLGADQSGHWRPLAMRNGVVDGTMFLPNEINTTEEETNSLYAMIRFGDDDTSDGGLAFSGNLGLRWVRTDFIAEGRFAFPQPGAFGSEADCIPPAMVPPGAPPWSPPAFCQAFPDPVERAAVYGYANGASEDYNSDTSYDNWLPSFNLKVNLTDDVLVRFGYSKAMARPDLGLTRSYFTINDTTDPDTGEWMLRADTGNGELRPIRSTQFDLSAEWYFSRVGQLSASFFYKELKDVWTNGYYTLETTNNGVTLPVTVVGPINSDETGTMQGFELAYQQFFDMLPGFWSGFGIQANYTYIDSSGVPQAILDNSGTGGTASNIAKVDTSYLPLTNMSKDNVNFQLMYAKGPVDARIAYSWRSRYLLTVRDVITPFSPIFNEDTGQLDASFMYSINDNVKVGLQAINLTDEIVETSQVLEADADHILTGGRSWFLSDRRVSAIVRVTF
jgi:TonB-dependent receptor